MDRAFTPHGSWVLGCPSSCIRAVHDTGTAGVADPAAARCPPHLRRSARNLTGDTLDHHTLAWVERLHSSGSVWLTPAQLDGRWMVRISIGALATERTHVEALWRELREVVV